MISIPREFRWVAGRITRREVLQVFGAGTIGLLAKTPARAQGAPAAKGKTTIRYWTFLNSNDTQNARARAQAQILAAFRTSHPDIEVVEEVFPWQTLQQQLLQAVAANRPPDVSKQLDRSLVALNEAGAIIPLDEFVVGWSAERKSDYVYAWDDTVLDGKKMAFRQAVRPANLLYYRTDLYEAAGLKGAPRTFKEFTESAKAIAKGQILGYIMPLSKSDGLGKFLDQAPPMYWSLGGDLVDPKTGKATFHLEAGQKILQWLQDCVYVHKISPVGEVSMDAEAVNQTFWAGTLVYEFTHSASWATWSQKEAIKGRIETAAMPNFADDPSKPAPVSTVGAWTLVIPRGAKKEAAWKLMEFLQNNEAELIDARVGGELPTRKSTLRDPFFQSPEAKRMMGWLKLVRENPHPATTLRIKKLPLLADVLADAAQQIIANKADVKGTLGVAAQKYDAQV
ncbi:MAG: extracellular solute-binding protein, partial [Candidatus Rokubacteria bacterium]|nr:extracellular solute-binding protein [Candidatus Rokubacteria bacterium]